MAIAQGAFSRLATDSVSGLVSTAAQTFAGVKTFSSAIVAGAGVQGASFFNNNGTGASDVGVKVGVSTADGSLNASAKLFSIRAGIGGTEAEKFYATRTGFYHAGTGIAIGSLAELYNVTGGLKSDGNLIGLYNPNNAAGLWLVTSTGRAGCSGNFDAGAAVSFGATTAATLGYAAGTFSFAGTYSVGAGGYYFSTSASTAFYAAASGGFSGSSMARIWSEQATNAGAVAVRLGTMIASPNQDVKLAQFVVDAANASPGEKAFVTARGEFESAIAGAGLVLKSPDGTRWRLTITNAGAVSVAAA